MQNRRYLKGSLQAQLDGWLRKGKIAPTLQLEQVGTCATTGSNQSYLSAICVLNKTMSEYPLVAIRSFIEATRDSGYKSTSSAIAELVDNAFEAAAAFVEILVFEDEDGNKCLSVTDNGVGMSAETMQLALQFGGTTRFDSRTGTGRYGMGLPNGSLSQGRRVEVYSWTNPNTIWFSYLDVDEIASGRLAGVPKPARVKRPSFGPLKPSSSGTSVVLKKCDRLDYRTIRAQVKRLHADLGRIFRKQLYELKVLRINGEMVLPFDPLFLQDGSNLKGAAPYGPPLVYDIAPNGTDVPRSMVLVRFSILPIEEWHGFSNEEKNRLGIAKGAGVSVIRSGREIDYGWYFMGSKRKENYDDWWRCEISFLPELDELFGVTHTKQKVNPTELILDILVPDLERIARDLNATVRKRYLAIRENEKQFRSETVAEKKDHLMQPLTGTRVVSGNDATLQKRGSRLGYIIDETMTNSISFYVPSLVRNSLKVVLNRHHNFYRKVYEPLLGKGYFDPSSMLEHLQLLILAAARAECGLKSRDEKQTAERLREAWSNALMAFLE